MASSPSLLAAIDSLSKGKLDKARSILLNIKESGSDEASTAVRFLAHIDKKDKKYYEAISTLENAIKEFGEDPKILAQLAEFYMALGNYENAIETAQRSLLAEPENSITSLNLTIWESTRNNDPIQIRKAFEQWSNKYLQELKKTAPTLHREGFDLTLDRRLRIGYLSGDFKNHPVRYLIEPYFELHDKSLFEIHAFMTEPGDQVTNFLKKYVHRWHNVQSMDDSKLHRLIREQKIDILIDLSGHTEGSRLEVFAARAAPVQVTWWGFVQTLGMRDMDYRLTDAITCPPEARPFYTESLCLMDCLTAYKPPLNCDAIYPPPWRDNGYVTMVSLNHTRKLSDSALLTWRQILDQNPDSGLMIITSETTEAGAGNLFEPRFRALNMPQDRVTAIPRLTMLEYMGIGSVADFALDSFPISGGVTTFHSIWMGLPVLTIRPKLPLAIQAYTSNILHFAGLDDCVAENQADLVQKASNLIRNREQIDKLRDNSKKGLLKSPFMDHKQRVRELERCFRAMWHKYCLKLPTTSFESQSIP